MYIRTLLDVQGTAHGPNHGMMAYTNLIWPAGSIFADLDDLQDALFDFGWQLVGVDVEELEFGVDQGLFLEQEYAFFTYTVN